MYQKIIIDIAYENNKVWDLSKAYGFLVVISPKKIVTMINNFIKIQ